MKKVKKQLPTPDVNMYYGMPSPSSTIAYHQRRAFLQTLKKSVKKVK